MTKTSVYYYPRFNGEIRFYHRDDLSTHNIKETPAEDKKFLKRLGFKWDNRNKSYVLYNPSSAVLEEIRNRFEVIER